MSPDFFRLVPWEGDGLRPVGYGYDSVEAIVETVRSVERAGEGLSGSPATALRQRAVRAVDEAGLIATPANSSSNELVVEAARMSILGDGLPVSIRYNGTPRVLPRDAKE